MDKTQKKDGVFVPWGGQWQEVRPEQQATQELWKALMNQAKELVFHPEGAGEYSSVGGSCGKTGN